LPREREKLEGKMGSLTEGFMGRCDGEERPAAERKKWCWSELIDVGLGARRRGDGVGNDYGAVWRGQGSLL
jgi:hypothetical protein